jgi:hypothetical protein
MSRQIKNSPRKKTIVFAHNGSFAAKKLAAAPAMDFQPTEWGLLAPTTAVPIVLVIIPGT